MSIITAYRTPDASLLVFSGSLESAREQGFVTPEELAYLRSLTPEILGMAADGWEGITGIEIFDGAPQ